MFKPYLIYKNSIKKDPRGETYHQVSAYLRHKDLAPDRIIGGAVRGTFDEAKAAAREASMQWFESILDDCDHESEE